MDNRCLAHIAGDNMVDFQCNFPHMNKLDGLVAWCISRMDRTERESTHFLAVEVMMDNLELDGTLQMDYPFHLDCSYKLDCD